MSYETGFSPATAFEVPRILSERKIANTLAEAWTSDKPLESPVEIEVGQYRPTYRGPTSAPYLSFQGHGPSAVEDRNILPTNL